MYFLIISSLHLLVPTTVFVFHHTKKFSYFISSMFSSSVFKLNLLLLQCFLLIIFFLFSFSFLFFFLISAHFHSFFFNIFLCLFWVYFFFVFYNHDLMPFFCLTESTTFNFIFIILTVSIITSLAHSGTTSTY